MKSNFDYKDFLNHIDKIFKYKHSSTTIEKTSKEDGTE